MKVLIIEDNAEFSLLLYDSLREAGYEADTALNGVEGIKRAISYRPDLILLDYNLGDMTGSEVATALKNARDTRHIPFIMLSSLGADPQLNMGFTNIPNCRAIVVKIKPISDILAVIRGVTG